MSSRGAALECDQLRQTGRRRTLHWAKVSPKGPSTMTDWRTWGRVGRQEAEEGGRRAEGTGGLWWGTGVRALRWQQQRGEGAPQPLWSSGCASAQPSANRQTGVSPAGYITHHCSAVSAVLYSAKHRMARPPGYATGAHVLAGCLS